MEIQNFAGDNGFNWFVGVVENRTDPAKLNRVQVRIIGVDDHNTNLMPVSSLPWAEVLLSANSPNSISVPREGEWVMGFYKDSIYKQQPVIIGIFPGLEPKKDNSKNGFKDPRSDKEKANGPQLPSGVVDRKEGQPTLTPLARAVKANTTIKKADTNLAHACDFSLYVKGATKGVRLIVKYIAIPIRWLMRQMLQLLGDFPAGNAFINMVKEIVYYIKKITDIIMEVKDLIQNVIMVIQEIIDIINWILALPQYLLKLFKDCINEAMKCIKDFFTLAVSEAGAEWNSSAEISGFSNANFGEYTKAFNDLGSAVTNLEKATASLVNTGSQLVNSVTSIGSSVNLESIGAVINEITTNGGLDAIAASVFPADKVAPDFIKTGTPNLVVPAPVGPSNTPPDKNNKP